MEQSNCLEEIRLPENPEMVFEKTDGSQPIDTTDDTEARSDFWRFAGNQIYRHYVESRLELCAHDYWNIDGDRNLWEPWTGFTQFTQLNEKPPDAYRWSGERRKQFKQQQGLIICGQKFGSECQKQPNEKKSSNGLSRNRSPTMREKLNLLTQKIRSSKKPSNTREKSWNCQRKQPCPVS